MRIHLIRSIFSSLLTLLRPGRWESVQTVSPQHLQTLLTQTAALLVLDVRNPDEFVGERGHIPAAVLAPLPELESKLSELQPYRIRTVITV